MSKMIKIYCYNYDLCKSSALIFTNGYNSRFGTYPLDNLPKYWNAISSFKSKEKELLNNDNDYWHLNIPRAIGLTMLISSESDVFFRNYTLCDACSQRQETLEAYQ